MDICRFGVALLETEDLDPVYIALHKSKLEHQQLKRVILGYSCFYHLGVAAKLSEFTGKRFWGKLTVAAVNEGLKWPRGSERRHFRGAQAILAVRELMNKYEGPEDAIDYWFGSVSTPTTFTNISKNVQENRGFGPWISFKLADMSERLGWRVDFSNCELGIYKDPKQGAALYKFRDYKADITNKDLRKVTEELVNYFRKHGAPPRYERSCNVQEVESILCKWKSHTKGHYEVGKDIREVRHHLVGWGRTAELLLSHMPEEVAL